MMANPELHSLDQAQLCQMLCWSDGIIAARAPDVVIGGDYLARWHVIPRNPVSNVYLHVFGRSDDDRALHDHPWDSISIILRGSYIEHTPRARFLRRPGDIVRRTAVQLHRIELIDRQPVTTLFLTGQHIREWGFQTPQGWVHWREFCGEAARLNRARETARAEA